jgi:hypothetical protein
MKYETEADNVQKGGDWIKLGVGVHKLTFLEEIPDPVKTKRTINGQEKEIEQCDVLVDYQGQRKKWSLTKGSTAKSVWGQLMILGKHHKTLTGVAIDVIIKTAKDKNGEDKKDYTVLQCAELLQKQMQLNPSATVDRLNTKFNF